MHDLALMAAQQWAIASAHPSTDPVQFGSDVARVYLAAAATVNHAGDERATAAAVAALSVPAEVWQSLALLSALARPNQEQKAGAGSVTPGAES